MITEETVAPTHKLVQVLLVEDNPIDARLLAADFRRLRSTEFELITVRSLGEARTAVQNNSIEVILLDLFLEDVGGLKALSQMREAAPETPVVVLTGLKDESQALQALKEGAQDYLIKGTIDASGLFRAIRYAIERKQAADERRALEQGWFQIQKIEALGTLVGGVAHHFNNALAIILGHANLILMETDSAPESRRRADSIKKAADRSAVLVRHLLTFSRRKPMEPQAVDLNKTILDMRVLLEALPSEDIELRLNLSPDTGSLKGEPGQFEQLIMNLVLNAHEAMPRGGVITIETGVIADNRILLSVADTGIGMSEETRSRIFEPFFTTKGIATASGMGLSTVYGIVRQHGGEIQVASTLGAGTSFTIVIPRLGSTKGGGSDRGSPARLREEQAI